MNVNLKMLMTMLPLAAALLLYGRHTHAAPASGTAAPIVQHDSGARTGSQD